MRALVQEVRHQSELAGLCDVRPVAAITKGLGGETLTEIGELSAAGVRMFSDDGKCVQRARLLRMALEYSKAFDAVIAEHCEEVSLAEGGQMHEGYHSSILGLAGVPSESEEMIVARDLMLAKLTGGRLHLCHLSSAGSVDLVRRAKDEGVNVTAEVTPHHLALTDEDLLEYDTNLKVNPPIRSAEDRDALRAGLADGTIDAVATDHAPHAVEDKEQEFDHAPPGTIGLETALGLGDRGFERDRGIGPAAGDGRGTGEREAQADARAAGSPRERSPGHQDLHSMPASAVFDRHREVRR